MGGKDDDGLAGGQIASKIASVTHQEEIVDPTNILYGLDDVSEECLSASECESQRAMIEALARKPIY